MTALSDTRRLYQELSALYLPIAAAVFAIVLAAVIYAAIRYRRRDGEDSYPHQRAGAKKTETAYVVVLTAIAALLFGATVRVEDRIDPVARQAGLQVDVTAAQWLWRFSYPGYGISIAGAQQAPPTLFVPTGTTVRFRMISQDVIHSFFVPAVRFKRDAFPRRYTHFDLAFDRPGLMKGECAEFCGLNHADMNFRVRALAPPAFRAWLRAHATRGAS